MRTFILWDPRDSDDVNKAWVAEMGRQLGPGYALEDIWIPVTPEYSVISAERSINLSHKKIVRRARELGLPEICILEGDICFPHPQGWKYFLDNKPATYSIYLGGVYGLNQTARNRLEPGVIPLHNWEGMHCYIIHASFYDKFLSVPEDQHIDVVMAGLGDFKVLYPFAAIQRPGWSATSKMNVNYNTLLTNEDVYGGNPFLEGGQ